MCQNAPCANEQNHVVDVGVENCVSWATDAAAAVDTSFPADGWTGSIDASIDSVGLTPSKYNTYITDEHVTQVSAGSATFTPSNTPFGATGAVLISDPPGDQGSIIVHAGEHLRFWFCSYNPSGPPGDVFLNTQNGISFINGPSSAEPVPLPELPTAALGLLGIAALGAVVVRRRQE